MCYNPGDDCIAMSAKTCKKSGSLHKCFNFDGHDDPHECIDCDYQWEYDGEGNEIEVE